MQEKSYFALRLPQSWWLFGLDLGLGSDIDVHQFRYFANLVEKSLGPGDNVIVVTHEPVWLLQVGAAEHGCSIYACFDLVCVSVL